MAMIAPTYQLKLESTLNTIQQDKQSIKTVDEGNLVRCQYLGCFERMHLQLMMVKDYLRQRSE